MEQLDKSPLPSLCHLPQLFRAVHGGQVGTNRAAQGGSSATVGQWQSCHLCGLTQASCSFVRCHMLVLEFQLSASSSQLVELGGQGSVRQLHYCFVCVDLSIGLHQLPEVSVVFSVTGSDIPFCSSRICEYPGTEICLLQKSYQCFP